MKADIYKINNRKSTKKAELPDSIFGIEPNNDAIYHAIRVEMANKRQGSHKVKGRSEVRGGGKKPWRQKGTGRARIGTIRAPHWRGGGIVFGPQPRDYSMKINHKVKQLARKSALSYKTSEENLKIVEDFSFEVPKTRQVVEILRALDLENVKTTLVIAKSDENLLKSCRNIPYLRVREADKVSTYDILDSNILLVQVSALNRISEVLN